MNRTSTTITRHRSKMLLAALALTASGFANADPVLPEFAKVGEGSLSWFGLSIYDASLWTPSGTYSGGGEPTLLTIRYSRDLSKQRIIETTAKEWRRLKVGDESQRSAWLAELEIILPEIRKDLRLSSLVNPESSTVFYQDGSAIGTVDDPEFGPAFLAIWLDPKTKARKLRKSLLQAENRAASARG